MNLLVAFVLMLAGPEYPKQTGLVNDFAGVLSQEARTKLQADLEGLQKAKSFVMVVVTVTSLENQSIEQYTVGLANAWAIGQKGKNNGVVFLIAPKEKALRIENGYGAEGTLTDIESKLIAEESIIPLFKEGKLAQGIEAGTAALVAKLGGAVQEAARPPPPKNQTGMMVLIAFVVVLVIILMCFPGGREFLWVILNIALQSGGSGGSKKSSGGGGSSSSGGGSFGGGGASSKW